MAATKFSNDPLRPGFRLSRYSIVRRLSAGGFGVVYVARREDGKLVAIKEFLPSVIACRRPEDKGIIKLRGSTDTRRFRDGLEAFFREADTLAKIHDDRVIAVWDVFEANGTAYFAMPIEKGITLQTAIRANPIPMSDAKIREIFVKACQGVEVLHQHGLLHLDLKPSNLWLRPDGKGALSTSRSHPRRNHSHGPGTPRARMLPRDFSAGRSLLSFLPVQRWPSHVPGCASLPSAMQRRRAVIP